MPQFDNATRGKVWSWILPLIFGQNLSKSNQICFCSQFDGLLMCSFFFGKSWITPFFVFFGVINQACDQDEDYDDMHGLCWQGFGDTRCCYDLNCFFMFYQKIVYWCIVNTKFNDWCGWSQKISVSAWTGTYYVMVVTTETSCDSTCVLFVRLSLLPQ